jgi:hypothetical protein
MVEPLPPTDVENLPAVSVADVEPVEPARSREAPEKSPWASSIGPVYTVSGMASALGWETGDVESARRHNDLFAIETVEGSWLFPARQISVDGSVVRGLRWILTRLRRLDRYTIAAWLNENRESLAGRSIWDVIDDSESLSSEVRSLVEERASSFEP